MKTTPHSEVLIVGAGPAGAAAAWRLAKAGQACTIVDKATFPRDKICGDALSGKTKLLLGRLDPESITRLVATRAVEPVNGIRFGAPNGKVVEIPFSVFQSDDPGECAGYVSRRLDFDAFMIDELKRHDNIDLQLGVEVKTIARDGEMWRLSSRDGAWSHTCRLLLVADGAQSKFAREVAGLTKRPAHNAGAVRAYMKGVTGYHPDGYIELHFLKEYVPGYFWTFPLPGGYSNVGLGMRTDKIKSRGMNLREGLLEIIESHPLLRDRYAGAELEEKIVGYPLPLGSKLRRASGDHYMVLGDAGHMIDPLTGEGIGNGMYSGVIAAEQALTSLRENDLSAEGLSDYDVRVMRVLGKEMQVSYNIQRSLRYPWITNTLVNIIHGNPHTMKALSRMYTDVEFRSKVYNPLFWMGQAVKGARARRKAAV